LCDVSPEEEPLPRLFNKLDAITVKVFNATAWTPSWLTTTISKSEYYKTIPLSETQGHEREIWT